MTTVIPVDHYTLSFEPRYSNGQQLVRAIAMNVARDFSAEALFQRSRLPSLLGQIYGGDGARIDNCMRILDDGQTLELTGAIKCLHFDSRQLVEFGFNPADLTILHE